jgi:hypothetical protein
MLELRAAIGLTARFFAARFFAALLFAAPLFGVPAAAAPPEADSGMMQHKDGILDSATSPLEDLNLRRIAIPAVLQRAVKSPYDLQGLDRCEQIAAEVGRLDAALGRDLDEPPPPDTRTRVQKVAGAAHDAAAVGAKSEVDHFIPFRGWIRMLSGAARHDKKVQDAIQAGHVRRGYLKGVGMRKNCAPPAAPSWFKPAPAPYPEPHPVHRSFAEVLARIWAGLVAWFQSWWPFR